MAHFRKDSTDDAFGCDYKPVDAGPERWSDIGAKGILVDPDRKRPGLILPLPGQYLLAPGSGCILSFPGIDAFVASYWRRITVDNDDLGISTVGASVAVSDRRMALVSGNPCSGQWACASRPVAGSGRPIRLHSTNRYLDGPCMGLTACD